MTESTREWEKLEESVQRQAWDDAAALAQKINVQRLPWPARERVVRALEQLPEEAARRPLLSVRRVQLAAGRGDWDQARRAYAALTGLRERRRENTPERQRAENLLSAALLMKQGTDNAQILLTLSVLYNELAGAPLGVNFSATGGRPSVLSGAKTCPSGGGTGRRCAAL